MQVTTATRLVMTIAVLGCIAGCRRAPELRPRLILQAEPVGEDFWLAAPYVLVVRIVRADLQGPLQPVFQGGPKTLQLVKFVADVENVIKGDLQDKRIGFFFFVKVDQNPRYYLDAGKRYIVSLRSEGGLLRSWADASQLNVAVLSGSHNQNDLPLDLGADTTIAYILLTPGIGCDLGNFASTLGMTSATAFRYSNPAYMDERLRQLQLSSNRQLRDSACLTAATIFWHRPECLEQALNSPDNGTRLAAAGLLKDDDLNLSGRLRDNPFSLFPKPWTAYMSQMFEIYAEDMRPGVRKSACESLRNFAPQDAVKRCKNLGRGAAE